MCKKCAKTCISSTHTSKNMQNCASQVLIYQKTCKNMQKHASQTFLDPIQKHASSRSVQLEAVLLKALLYFEEFRGLRFKCWG